MLKSTIALFSSSLCVFTLCNAVAMQQSHAMEQEIGDVTQPTHATEQDFSDDSQLPHATEEECGNGPQHIRIGARYTTPRGVGYTNGYTTLEGFFSPLTFCRDAWLPFLDLRGHVFDNGKFAANAGLGLRYLATKRVWGGNAYYDYRNTKHQHYNQFSAGLESLGTVWDFRVNGYLPVGWKQSHSYNIRFAGFQGHYLLERSSKEYAFKGANAETGVHVDHFKKAPLYFAGGPYYLTGAGNTAWGGELRAVVEFWERRIRIEGNTSYDHVFKWVGQGQVSFNIPFGRKSKVVRKGDRSCSQERTLYARAVQQVDRNEIIPVTTMRTLQPAINPATGDPWIFWFVNNTSSSAGTYESPFPTLLQAQNSSTEHEAIYVYPGDGTTKGMNEGITLQNDQLFLGASVSHLIPTTRGIITIPPLADSLPNITSTTFNVITVANNDTVSGFYVTVPQIVGSPSNSANGIIGTGITNLLAEQNTFFAIANSAFVDQNGIQLSNPSGQIAINDNNLSGFADVTSGTFGNGIYVNINNLSTLSDLSIANNYFNNITDPSNNNGGNSILLTLENSAVINFTVSDNIFATLTGSTSGTAVILNGGSITNWNVTGNSYNNINGSIGVYMQLNNGSIIEDVNVIGNSFNNLAGGSEGIRFSPVSNGGTVSNLNVEGCYFNNLSGGSEGITIAGTNGTSVTHFNATGNMFTNIQDACQAINYNLDASVSNATLNVSGNAFVGNNLSAGNNGFAADLVMNAGTGCLEFLNNNASPISNPAPYVFSSPSAASFNRTTGSDDSTNIGTILLIGTVNGTGSCTQSEE